MKYKFPEIKDVDSYTLLRIAQENFLEYKSYTKTFLFSGKAVCINRNPFFRVHVFVKHKGTTLTMNGDFVKENSTTLIVNGGLTTWGILLGGGLWWFLFFRGFVKEVASVYYNELFTDHYKTITWPY